MRLYAIADLHLSAARPKPMRVFGGAWANHPCDLLAGWHSVVGDDDVVLVPGDLSWASRWQDLALDLEIIDSLPGAVKVLSQGNHDYGWGGQARMQRLMAVHPTLRPLVHTATRVQVGPAGLVVAAVRGHLSPGDAWFGAREVDGQPVPCADRAAEDNKRHARELRRLGLALDRAAELRRDGDLLCVQIHYPPFRDLTAPSEMTDLIEAAGADLCVFGHLHSPAAHAEVFQGVRGGVRYRLVSCDSLSMTPCAVADLDDGRLRIL